MSDIKEFLKAKISKSKQELEMIRKTVDVKVTDLDVKDEAKRAELFQKFMVSKDKIIISQTVINVCEEILKELEK